MVTKWIMQEIAYYTVQVVAKNINLRKIQLKMSKLTDKSQKKLNQYH